MRVPILGLLLTRFVSGIRAAEDERNARRLARRLGCSLDDARRVYRLARERGYGAAYDEVFGSNLPGS